MFNPFIFYGKIILQLVPVLIGVVLLVRRFLWSHIVCSSREFLGIPQLQERFFETLSRTHLRVIDALDERQRRREAEKDAELVLACVTVLCDTVNHAGKKARTTMGGECFIMPGGRATIQLTPQQMTGNYTYFVSGHPNIVIRGLKFGNESMNANMGSVKYGECSGAIELGTHITVELEYVERIIRAHF